MRTPLAVIATLLAFEALAQSTARPLPQGARPLDDAPPPPPLTESRNPAGQVTTRTEGEQVIEEHRINGKLFMQKVTPKHGKPYILMDNRGDGTFSRLDNNLDPQVRVPQWVLLEF
jgi:hypothetical protein